MIHPSAKIHPTALVADGAVIGEDVVIGPFCIIEGSVEIKARTVLKFSYCRERRHRDW